MIVEGSRYETASVRRILTASGDWIPAIYPAYPYAARFRFTPYVTVFGDRLDALAHRFYRDPEAWWVLALANPEVVYPDDLPIGTLLRVPHAPNILSR